MLEHRLPKLIALMTVLVLSGCATQQPRYGHDGVYYEQPRVYRAVDPMVYPYWSLDYFYFSRYYHPYSVIVHHYDPWFYPYPGWYYGYRPGPRSRISMSFGYYPWHSFGSWYYGYQPWRPLYVHYPRHQQPVAPSGQQRVQQMDERLRETERRQRAQAVRQPLRPDPADAGTRGPWADRSIDRTTDDRRRAAEQGRIERRIEGVPPRERNERHEPPLRQERAAPRRSDPVRSREPQPIERRQPPERQQRPSPPPATSTPPRESSAPSNRPSAPVTRQPAPRRDSGSSPPRREGNRQRER